MSSIAVIARLAKKSRIRDTHLMLEYTHLGCLMVARLYGNTFWLVAYIHLDSWMQGLEGPIQAGAHRVPRKHADGYVAS